MSSWAQLPTSWMALPYNKFHREYFESSEALDKVDDSGLRSFVWRKDGSSSAAALMVLIALSLELGSRNHGQRIPLHLREPTISMSIDKLTRVTGFARRSIVSGIGLLEEVGAIAKKKVGRANVYELLGLNVPGQWCQIPTEALRRPDGALRMKEWRRNRAMLDAIKVYVALLAARSVDRNTAALGYEGIQRYTGIARRQNLGTALSMLFSEGFISAGADRDDRSATDQSRRYRITGLRAKKMDDDLGAELASASHPASPSTTTSQRVPKRVQ